ncbi:MAG: DUF192 domain-containing protein [Burkholderiaceae bacterium]
MADTFGARLRGLLGRQALLEQGGLLLTPCCAVHTLGMHRQLDLLFLDLRGSIIAVAASLGPRRWRACAGAHSVLELAAGGLVHWQARIGESLHLVPRDTAAMSLRPPRSSSP